MSSAQAAASAAFQASKTPAASLSRKRKSNLRLEPTLSTSYPKIQTPRAASYPEIPTARENGNTEPPASNGSRRYNSRRAYRQSARANSISAVVANGRNGVVLRRGSKITRTLLDTSKDTTIGSKLDADYCNLPRSTPAPPIHAWCDTPTLKGPASTKPQDMLDLVRQSINSKSKTGTCKEVSRKSQLAINEFRQSVDLRRLISRAASVIGSLYEDIHHRQPTSNIFSPRNLGAPPYCNTSANCSGSSLGSAVSDGNNTDAPPTFTQNFKFSSKVEMGSSETPKHTLPSPHNARSQSLSPSPIPVSLSSQGIDKALSTISLDGLATLSGSPGLLGISSSDALVETEHRPAKPGRKKPPSFHDAESFCGTSGLDLEYGGQSLDHSDLDTDDAEGVKLPLFPGISEKHHHRIGLFSKRKKNKRDLGVVYDPEPLHPDENEQLLAPSGSGGRQKLTKAAQPVKFRTTMRNENKRKEKKTAFNEDKPWKNHRDLDVISDAQRKRYEGLWVSNKGLYLDHVATKLVGVDYGMKESCSLSKSVGDYSEKDISERAAQLSANLNADSDQPDINEQHGLEKVTTQNLIHGSVVRRIWSRSNLSRDTLQAIWDLVDCRKDSTLSKAEFIVGMWLVDQCLYGRKLPKAVNKLVWASLGGLGVNVVIKKKRR